MKRKIISGLLFLLLVFTVNISAQKVNITFKVDMNGLNTSAGVYVGSDWAGWSFDKFQQLTDDNNDGIFEATLPITSGVGYNYRYTIGNIDWNNFEDLSGTTCGNGPKKQDRRIVIPTKDSVLNVVCFNSCTDCASTKKTYLHLSVDMHGQIVSENGVHVTGSFNAWDPSSFGLKDEDGDSIYETTIQVSPDKTYEYKFLNGNSWGTEEHVYGTCEFRSNRLVTITEDSTVAPLVKFAYCDASGAELSGTRIACVGNSITHGYGTSDMYTKCWPFQLRNSLGDGFYAENLGVSGSTMLKTGDLPWWNQPQFSFTFEFQPNIIVIKLGTNDSKSLNWNAVKYKADYIDLIDTFRSMTTKPTIYMVTPAKAYSAGWGISDNTIRTAIIPILNEIAFEKGVNLIDMYNSTLSMSGNFPDGIHPNDKGAGVIASKVKENLLFVKPAVSQVLAIDEIVTNTAYQWFYNNEPIAGANAQTINVSKAGKYKVAVKIIADKNDIYVSDEFDLVLTGNASTVGLTTNISVATSVNDVIEADNISIYPNPVSNSINIENAKNFNVLMLNTLGEYVLSLTCDSNNQSFNLPDLKSGIYFLKFTNGNKSLLKKLVVN